MVDLLRYDLLLSSLTRCSLVITDSGGIQEECSLFGVLCNVVRRNTERPECVNEGISRLVEPEDLMTAARLALLDAPRFVRYNAVMGRCVIGDGRAGRRIAIQLASYVDLEKVSGILAPGSDAEEVGADARAK